MRPSAAYAPKALPLRHVERPDLAARARTADGDAESPAEEAEPDGDEGDSGTPHIPVPISPDDPDLLAMGPERRFSSRVWTELQAESDTALAERGAALLDSDSPEDRALGAALLFFADALDEAALARILGDDDLAVPLTLYDWIRDFGSEEASASFRDELRSLDLSEEALRKIAAESSGTFGGGRAALDLWLDLFAGGDALPADALASIVSSPNASYDVRSQGLLKLLEPETKAFALDAMAGLTSSGGDSDLSAQFLEKLANLAEIADEGDDCKIWDSQAPVVFFLTQDSSALPARDLANYLEYALRRDDPEIDPNIEEGTWEFANDYLEQMRPLAETLSLEEVDALDRIAASLDKLVDYDPAFNPFETVEDDGDEPNEPDDAEDEDEEDAEDEDDSDEEGDDSDADEDDSDADEDDEESDDDAEDDAEEEADELEAKSESAE